MRKKLLIVMALLGLFVFSYEQQFLYSQRIIGLGSQLVWSRLSECGRCWRVWAIVEGHSTRYSYESIEFNLLPHEMAKPDTSLVLRKISSSWGCFPLCENCWKVLTVEERLPYYSKMIDGWRKSALEDRDDRHLKEVELKEIQIIKAVLMDFK
jgi:hypothetical protein